MQGDRKNTLSSDAAGREKSVNDGRSDTASGGRETRKVSRETRDQLYSPWNQTRPDLPPNRRKDDD